MGPLFLKQTAMPSPFPGMDPYLEDPNVFPNLHDKLVVHLEEFIQPQLPEPYFAKAAHRVWLEYADSRRIPDVSVVAAKAPAVRIVEPESAVAVAEYPIKVTANEIPWEEYRETYLEIYWRPDREARLVTSIEVLSPTNKTPGDESHGAYRKKQKEMLRSKVNLIEIDLLRAGLHTTAVPRKELMQRCPSFDYHVCLHHFDQPGDFFIYPIHLPDKLPTITVPLLPGDQPVHAELQAIFAQCYDRGPYRREIDYSKDPPPPALPSQRLAWTNEILAAIRSAN
jgi:uncharacterized protein DUF4058